MAQTRLAKPFLDQARRLLKQIYLPRIARCLEALSAEQIWWRANPPSNSVGNLVLHLEGNVRQWIISGLGGAPDLRQRDREFQERGPIPRRELVRRLNETVKEASRVFSDMSASDLARTYSIQSFHVTGLQAIFHVTEHFSHHAGQIISMTKALNGKDLAFTKLPGQRTQKSRGVPAV
jgi:uncharacterized damage-inducible protein DinB